MSYVFVLSSLSDSGLIAALEQDGEVLLLSSHPNLRGPESTHADLQIFPTGDRSALCLKGLPDSVKTSLENRGISLTFAENQTVPEYPGCCGINALRCGNYLFHNFAHSDPALLRFAEKRFLVRVPVKQGYTGCSSFYHPGLDLLVSADSGILAKARTHGFNTYPLPEEKAKTVRLPGYDVGMIGGAVGYDPFRNVLYVNGCLSAFDYELYQLILRSGTRIIENPRVEGLTDVGGIRVFRTED